MADKPAVLTINPKFNRTAPTGYESLAGLPIGNVVDAQGRTGALDYRIKPITSFHQFVGSALTVDAGPRDNLAAWCALEYAQKGDVLMISTGGYALSSVIGDLFAGFAANAGVSAIVTDGVVRDLAGLEAVGIPVFALGISSNSPQKNGPGKIGTPIVVGGVSVASGDIICGDQDGVVVVAQQTLSALVKTLPSVIEKEKGMDGAVRAGEMMPGWVQELKKTLAVEYLD